MKWFHLHDCNMEIVRGADWCKPGVLQWSDRKRVGRNGFGATLRDAYDAWSGSDQKIEVDRHKDTFLAYIRAIMGN